METHFHEEEKHFMALALQEAEEALEKGDYPVGAVLTVNGELWGQARNSLMTDDCGTSHAEHKLLYEHSSRLRRWRLQTKAAGEICLYTTLEPCLMCLGIAVMHRVSKIVVACPDPHGGTTALNLASIGSVYRMWWPEIRMGLFKEESCDLIIEFLKSGRFMMWESMLRDYNAMQRSWQEN